MDSLMAVTLVKQLAGDLVMMLAQAMVVHWEFQFQE
jgi:hypothetical protein